MDDDVLVPPTAPTRMLSEELSSPWQSLDSGSISSIFEDHGLVVDRAAVSSSSVLAACRAEALATLAATLALPEEDQRNMFPAIRAPAHRHDVRLELSPNLLALLSELLCADRPIGFTVAACLGEEAVLCELSCIVSENGSAAQNAHADTPNDSLATDALALALADTTTDAASERPRRLLTAFVALQNIDATMGPTLIWPGTQRQCFHDAVLSDGGTAFNSTIGTHMNLSGGAAALMDSRTWHCGGANASETRRCVLVASFGAAGSLPLGSTYSILPHLVGRLTLRRLRDAHGMSPETMLDEPQLCVRQHPHGAVASMGASVDVTDDDDDYDALLAWMAGDGNQRTAPQEPNNHRHRLDKTHKDDGRAFF